MNRLLLTLVYFLMLESSFLVLFGNNLTVITAFITTLFMFLVKFQYNIIFSLVATHIIGLILRRYVVILDCNGIYIMNRNIGFFNLVGCKVSEIIINGIGTDFAVEMITDILFQLF